MTIFIIATKFYPGLEILHRSNMSTNKLTCMFICQYNKCTWNVSSSVETHHLCLHVSIGSLKKKKKKDTIQNLNCMHRTRTLQKLPGILPQGLLRITIQHPSAGQPIWNTLSSVIHSRVGKWGRPFTPNCFCRIATLSRYRFFKGWQVTYLQLQHTTWLLFGGQCLHLAEHESIFKILTRFTVKHNNRMEV